MWDFTWDSQNDWDTLIDDRWEKGKPKVAQILEKPYMCDNKSVIDSLLNTESEHMYWILIEEFTSIWKGNDSNRLQQMRGVWITKGIPILIRNLYLNLRWVSSLIYSRWLFEFGMFTIILDRDK